MEKNKLMHIMIKRTFILPSVAVFTFFCFAAAAQATIVKTNHSGLLAKIPAVPSTAQEAFSKCVKDKDGKLKANPLIEKLSAELEKLMRENAVPYGPEAAAPGNVPQNMPSEEQIKKMTQQEKIAFAIKMQAQMKPNMSAPANTEVYSKTLELNGKFIDLNSNDPLYMKLLDMDKHYSPEHSRITEDTNAAAEKCPGSMIGEMTEAGIKCAKEKRLSGAEKHIALAAKELGELQKLLTGHTARIKGLLAELDQVMKEAKYGEGIDSQTKTMLNQAQGLALQQILQIQKAVQESYLNSGKWIAEKQEILEMKYEK